MNSMSGNEQDTAQMMPYQAFRLDLLRNVHDLNTLTDALLAHQLTGAERLTAIRHINELMKKIPVYWVCNCCTNPHHLRADCPDHGLRG